MKMNNKDFDCIAFKRKAQSTIYNEIKDFSPVEEINYFKQKVALGPFGEWWRSIKNKTDKMESMIVAENGENYGRE